MEKVNSVPGNTFQREDLFLGIARRMLLKDGYHGLTMAKVAEAAAYSKGTIYQHFTCKEDVIVTLMTRGLERRQAFLERATVFKGRPRERMVAMGEALRLHVRLYPDDVRLCYVGSMEAVVNKASERFRWNFRRCMECTADLFRGVILEGIDQGDLTLPQGVTPEQVEFVLRALSSGAYSAMLSGTTLWSIGIGDAQEVFLQACRALLDGYGWRPLSHEWDYEETRRRVEEEIFPGEIQTTVGLTRAEGG